MTAIKSVLTLEEEANLAGGWFVIQKVSICTAHDIPERDLP